VCPVFLVTDSHSVIAAMSSSASSSLSTGAALDSAQGPLGKISITQQPERVFYKDEGGQKLYYLYVFFVVQAQRTVDLKRAFDRASNGRRKIPVECKLLYEDGTHVEEPKTLQLLGSSVEGIDVSEGIPEYDPNRGTGSVRYRINKVSMKKDNQGFKVRIWLRGLEDVVEPADTEPTMVLSKRKRLRKKHREPEQEQRDEIEKLARLRNEEVERKLARAAPTSTPLIHRIASARGLPGVPDYPDLRTHPDDDDEAAISPALPGSIADEVGDGALFLPASKKRKKSSVSQPLSYVTRPEFDAALRKLDELKGTVESMVSIIQSSMPSYTPENDTGATSNSNNDSGTGAVVPPKPGQTLDALRSFGLQGHSSFNFSLDPNFTTGLLRSVSMPKVPEGAQNDEDAPAGGPQEGSSSSSSSVSRSKRGKRGVTNPT